LQLPPADADQQFVEEDEQMIDVQEEVDQQPGEIIDVSDEVIEEHNVEVVPEVPVIKSQSSHVSSQSNRQFLQVQGAGVVSQIEQELGIADINS
jgi:hypothetical protein